MGQRSDLYFQLERRDRVERVDARRTIERRTMPAIATAPRVQSDVIAGPPLLIRPGAIPDFRPVQAMLQHTLFDPPHDCELIAALSSRVYISRVAYRDGAPVGIAYGPKLGPGEFGLDLIAVDSFHQGKGYGRELLRSLAPGFPCQPRIIKAWCFDDELGAHLFLRACGYRAVKVVGNQYLFVNSEGIGHGADTHD
jgi:GNAT superfamily N-acetyltransferase